MAQGRDGASLWKIALTKKQQGPRWMELVKHALDETNTDAKKEQLCMVSRWLLMRQMVAEDKANEISEMRAALNSEDNSSSGQPLDLDAIEEYLEGEEAAEEDMELRQEFEKNVQKHAQDQARMEDEILKTPGSSKK